MKVGTVFILLAMLFGQEKPDYMDAKPLSEMVKARVQPVSGGKLQIPVITWGGDVATVLAHSEGVLKQEGIDADLFLENNFQKQVEAVISGKTPYLRGTAGMVNAAAEAMKKNGLDLVVVYQMTWSNGGDVMVVRDTVKTPADLKGKTIALQYAGPHMDYAANIAKNAKIDLADVKFKWLKELTLPGYDTKGKIVDSVSAFQQDSSVDAVMVISPDAMVLTSGGKVGTGAEGSVKGAKILLSTKTASRVIADFYAVRKDWFDANRDKVQKFVHALMLAQENLTELVDGKDKQAERYNKVLKASASLLLGSDKATADVEGLLADCEFVGHAGNVEFFTGQGTTRTLANLTDEIQASFIKMGLMKEGVKVVSADWDYNALAQGLKNTKKSDKPKFDKDKVENKINAESENFSEDGTLFMKEVYFKPNQKDFPEADYAEDFREAVRIIQTYNGALVVIEGHADPEGIRRAKERGESQTVIAQMEQQAKNLSLQRAQAVFDSLMEHCKKEGLKVDESQYVPVGMGVKNPKYKKPATKEQWLENMRVVFRIRQVEAELEEFTPDK